MKRENKMNVKWKKGLSGILLVMLLTAQLVGCGLGKTHEKIAAKDDVKIEVLDMEEYGALAYQYVEYLQENLSQREAGTKQEKITFDYLKKEIMAMGYLNEDIETQKFTMENGLKSKNLVIKKKGIKTKEIIIAAHYDSVATHGVDDNGSGVAAILECAKRASNIETPYSFRFIFFGSEETGLEGSSHYAACMTEEEIKNTLFMINIDSILAGDFQYFYGGRIADSGKIVDTQALQKIEKLAKEKNLDMQRNPDGNPDYPAPTTGDWSDHVPFKDLKIQYVYFEATNWELPPFDGMMETKLLGEIMHTSNDDLEVINKVFPGRGKKTLADYSKLLGAIIECSELD